MGLSIAIAVVLSGTAALGDSPSLLRLDYVAAGECPDAAAFMDQLQARSPRARLAAGDEPAHTLIVRIQARAGRVAGRLTLRELDGTASERSVVGETCKEVASGLAFIAAIAIDRGATSPSPPLASQETPPARAAPLSTAPAPPVAAEQKPKPAQTGPEKHALDTSRAARSYESPTDPDAGRSRWLLSMGIHGGAVSGVSPRILLSLPVFVELASPSRGLVAPTARVGFDRAGTGDVGNAAGAARFTWTVGTLDACPFAWPARSAARLQPCMRAEAGVLDAIGVDVQPPRSRTRPWFSVGPVLRGQWMILGAVFFEIDGTLLLPTVRDRFFLEPTGTIFQAPWIGWRASGGVGVSFL